VELKKTNPDLKIMISVGGWLVKSTPFDRILVDKQALQKFVLNVIEFLKIWKFDGIDVRTRKLYFYMYSIFRAKLLHGH
jgi:chitinase